MAEIGMIGAGSWGTALTWLLTNNGHHVTVWSALDAEIEMLKKDREQKSKLPGGYPFGGYPVYHGFKGSGGRKGSAGAGCAFPVYKKHRRPA